MHFPNIEYAHNFEILSNLRSIAFFLLGTNGAGMGFHTNWAINTANAD